MKKIKNTTLAIIAVCALFSSCTNHGTIPTTTSKWVVERIAPNDRVTSIYLVEPIENGDLNMNSTWIVDSIGKFNAGDTLSFQLSK